MRLTPRDAEAHYRLSNALNASGRLDQAIEALNCALDLNPDFHEAYVRLAVARQESGLAAQALKAIERALELNPRSGEAWQLKSDLKTFAPGDPDIDAMEAVLATAEASGLAPNDRLRLHFALGKAWMDVPDEDRAFAHLNVGNREKRAALSYDAVSTSEWIASIAKTFTPDLMSRFAGAGHRSELPIFIVGMPRSGTTLIEQVLSSHPQVFGAGELALLENLVDAMPARSQVPLNFPRVMSLLSRDDLDAIGGDYVKDLSNLSLNKSKIIDKMPGNFHFVGLINLLMPNARIIHCRRDRIDTCLSCYTKLFTDGQEFSYDLRELGLFYRDYEGLMSHWRALIAPDRFIEVHYEDVVANLEPQARRLVAFCGLDWDPACLAFDKTARPVATASVNQVRQPLYRASVGRWRAYERHLAPLLDALNSPHSNIAPGA